MKFSELSLNESLLEAIDYMGFETATPIQEEAIPIILGGKDLIACAQTGTGKTAAFLLPVINMLVEKDLHGTKVLILAPTRELAIQIDQQVQALVYFAGMHSIAIYGGGGGSDWDQQKKALTKGAEIIVATPGKLISHLDQGYVKFNEIEYLILDEADRMLDIGFQEDLLKIISHVPKKRQSLLFSATMPKRIRDFASKILKNPDEINLKTSKPAEGVLQAAYLVSDAQKIPLIKSLISDKPNYKSILIFSTTKKGVREIVSSLRNNKYQVTGISSDLEQKERERVLREYKARNIRVLVATDVLSRGIDIKDIDLVINYNVPGDEEDYVHRVGRTARAASSGVALTLVNRKEMGSFKDIEAFIEREIPKLNPPPGMQPDRHKRPPQKKRHYRGKSRK